MLLCICWCLNVEVELVDLADLADLPVADADADADAVVIEESTMDCNLARAVSRRFNVSGSRALAVDSL